MLFLLRGTEATAKASGTIGLTFSEILYVTAGNDAQKAIKKMPIINTRFGQEYLLI